MTITRKPRFIISLEGVEGTGKTRFALTAPDPILYLGFEYGLEGVADQPEFAAKRITESRYDLTVPPNIDPKTDAGRIQAASMLQTEMNRFYLDAYRAVGAHRTVVVDTGSEAWSGTRAAWIDDSYKEQERRFLDLVRHYYKNDTTNLILLHRFKPSWKRGGGKVYKDTSVLGEIDGMDGIRHDMQLALECKYHFPEVSGTGQSMVMVKPGAWWQKVLKCRDNGQLTGLELPAMDFASWAAMAYPGVDWSK